MATAPFDARWTCAACQSHNFHSKKSCTRCQTPRHALLAGDWTCSACKSHNFQRNARCFSCRAPHPNRSWACPSCQTINYSRRVSCISCQCPSRTEADCPPPSSFSHFWICHFSSSQRRFAHFLSAPFDITAIFPAAGTYRAPTSMLPPESLASQPSPLTQRVIFPPSSNSSNGGALTTSAQSFSVPMDSHRVDSRAYIRVESWNRFSC
jgi:hypothetical protein